MSKIIAAVFTAVVAPILVVVITQCLKVERSKPEQHAAPGQDKQHPGERNKPNQITAEGVGYTAELALKEACRNAVRMFLPLVIDPDQVTKNESVINERVLNEPEDLVRKFEETEKRKGMSAGKEVYLVKIAATIDRQAVVAKLRAAQIKVSE
jgi:hypothetical protein